MDKKTARRFLIRNAEKIARGCDGSPSFWVRVAKARWFIDKNSAYKKLDSDERIFKMFNGF